MKVCGRCLVTLAAALGVSVAADAGASQPLGRLFFTPAQRMQIEAAQSGARQVGGAAAAAAAPTRIVLNGIVRSSRGGLVAWLDGQAVAEGARYGELRVHIRNQGVELRGDGGQRYLLRVGRSLMLDAGGQTGVDVGVRRFAAGSMR